MRSVVAASVLVAVTGAALFYFMYLPAMNKYNKLRADTFFAYSVVFDNKTYHTLKLESSPRFDPNEMPAINSVFGNSGFRQGCDGLVAAMNYNMPKWDWLHMGNNRLSASRALLKSVISEISLDKTIYVRSDQPGMINAFIIVNSDRILTDHWSDDGMIVYQTRMK